MVIIQLLHEREIVLHDRDSIDPLVWFNEINGLLRDLGISPSFYYIIHG